VYLDRSPEENVSEQIERVSANRLREVLNSSARRFHATCQRIGDPYHRSWTFERCPAQSCTEARAAIGIPQPEPLVPAGVRSPGEEG
jgi:hypothetical protein